MLSQRFLAPGRIAPSGEHADARKITRPVARGPSLEARARRRWSPTTAVAFAVGLRRARMPAATWKQARWIGSSSGARRARGRRRSSIPIPGVLPARGDDSVISTTLNPALRPDATAVGDGPAGARRAKCGNLFSEVCPLGRAPGGEPLSTRILRGPGASASRNRWESVNAAPFVVLRVGQQPPHSRLGLENTRKRLTLNKLSQ